ncbi:MAG: hypothetical protein IID54_04850 [Proteobacteria bacterium]|nr:hypothetical protein [Pseudomonadota bacterium]
MERAVTQGDSKIAGRLGDLRTGTNQAIRNELRDITAGEAPGQVTREFIQGRVDRVRDLLDRRASNAVRLARQRADEAGPDISRQEASTIVRNELDAGLVDARAQERAFWKAIDPSGETTISTLPLRERVKELRARQRKADKPENVPDEIANVIEKQFDDAETVEELLALRSRILEDGRAERALPAPNRRKIANLNSLQESILETLGATADALPGELGARARAAIEFSRDLNEKFLRGPIGRVLGFERAGGAKVPDIQTLEKLFQPGIKGDVGVQALLRAASGNEGLVAATEQFIRGEYFRQTADMTGRINPAAAQRFVRKHDEALSRFPKLKSELSDVETAQRLANTVEASAKARQLNILNVRRSRAALFLDQEPEKAIARVLGSRKPRAAMRELVKQTSKDKTGQASQGLKTLFADEMFRRVELQTIDQTGEAFLSSSRLVKFIAGAKGPIAELYSVQDIKRLRIVVKALEVAERSLRAQVRGAADLPKIQNVLIQSLGRIIGARVGAKIGTTPLISAGIGGRIARAIATAMPERQINDILKQAMFDPEVMKTLLMQPTRQNAAIITRRLRGHLVNLGGTTRTEDEDE